MQGGEQCLRPILPSRLSLSSMWEKVPKRHMIMSQRPLNAERSNAAMSALISSSVCDAGATGDDDDDDGLGDANPLPALSLPFPPFVPPAGLPVPPGWSCPYRHLAYCNI